MSPGPGVFDVLFDFFTPKIPEVSQQDISGLRFRSPTDVNALKALKQIQTAIGKGLHNELKDYIWGMQSWFSFPYAHPGIENNVWKFSTVDYRLSNVVKSDGNKGKPAQSPNEQYTLTAIVEGKDRQQKDLSQEIFKVTIDLMKAGQEYVVEFPIVHLKKDFSSIKDLKEFISSYLYKLARGEH